MLGFVRRGTMKAEALRAHVEETNEAEESRKKRAVGEDDIAKQGAKKWLERWSPPGDIEMRRDAEGDVDISGEGVLAALQGAVEVEKGFAQAIEEMMRVCEGRHPRVGALFSAESDAGGTEPRAEARIRLRHESREGAGGGSGFSREVIIVRRQGGCSDPKDRSCS